MKYRIFFIVFICFLFSLISPAYGGKRVNLDITSAGAKKVPLAVPYFRDKNNPDSVRAAAKDMSLLTGKALDFHGFIKTIPADSYKGKYDQDWKSIGADFAVLGQFEVKDKSVVIELRLIDVNESRMILGRRYRAPWDKRREMVLRFCDQVIEKLSGTPGISTTQIAFVSDKTGNKEIYLSDIFGDSVRQVTKHNYLAVSPRLSPDNKKLAYTSYHRGNANLYITDLSQSKTTRAVSRRTGLNMAPAWNPDGKSFVATLSKDGNPDLYLLQLNGSIVRRLTSNAGINVSPDFSPDGKQLVFVSDRSGEPQIYIMNFKTGGTRRLTYEGMENTTPSWSPDGKWIAYTSKYEGRYQIFKIPPEGGKPVQLTTSWGEHESPSWSPDSRQIVFARKMHEKRKLYVVSHNGSNLRALFSMQGNESSPQWSSRTN
ncbi:MAG: Tol-Pal system beta propeller repeat protein TolB [Desulfobulbaceae bacterium]|nr:Tol-Pal system beta propeller repeat protein TolB [Desulfobulbaceae bacterium]